MVITMPKFEETREYFLGQVCEASVHLNIGGELVSPGGCLFVVLNVKQPPAQYGNSNLAAFTVLHYYRETHHLGQHYLTPDMLRKIS